MALRVDERNQITADGIVWCRLLGVVLLSAEVNESKMIAASGLSSVKWLLFWHMPNVASSEWWDLYEMIF